MFSSNWKGKKQNKSPIFNGLRKEAKFHVSILYDQHH